jgi:acyl-CoA reductase-like NAD-dependent aldehyde dehydrogenase
MAARNLKTVTLELGGKSPNIVFDDADLDQAVKGVVSGIFAASGQSCQAGSRLLLQESIHDRFIEKLIAFMKDVKLGDPKLATQVGPIATRPQFEKIMGYIEIAKAEGARCVLGGRSRPDLGAGQFVEPTIFTGVRNDMRIAQEEVFGPVLAVIPFKDEADAIRIGNDTLFGLAAAVWTQGPEARHADDRQAQGRHGLGQQLPRHQLHLALRRLQAVGHRPRVGHGNHQGIPAHQVRLDVVRPGSAQPLRPPLSSSNDREPE